MNMTATDEELLARQDGHSFELFYSRYFERVLSFFSRRTANAELAADLTAETFACALVGRRRYRQRGGAADSWLFAIAYHKLADAQRRGYAEDRARRRLGMERIDLTDADIARIDRLGERGRVSQLVASLPSEQQEAIRGHVIHERSYRDIAQATHTSEVVVRKRVSRGLATLRGRIGGSS
jgi:RNA polymerase sigma-70 factor (ECF subfamily)